MAVVLVAACSRTGSSWLLPVAVLLYLLIVVPTALLCGFWQAVIVSLSAVVVHSYFTARPVRSSIPAADRGQLGHAAGLRADGARRSAGSPRASPGMRAKPSPGAAQMHDLYEFTRRTLQMNLHVEPGPQLAELVHEIFALEAVAVFDADLHEVYQAGYLERRSAGAGAERLLL